MPTDREIRASSVAAMGLPDTAYRISRACIALRRAAIFVGKGDAQILNIVHAQSARCRTDMAVDALLLAS